ncbi:MAG: hypothetical protein AAF514_00830 [Verrucomicrobiota bacterium]
MKFSIKSFLALFGAMAAFQVTPALASISFVGVTVPWVQGADNDIRTGTADTIGGNSQWNAYLRPTGGSLINSGDSANLRFAETLDDGTHNYQILLNHQSWVDNSPNNPGSYLNLFFEGDLSNPGISAKLAGGNAGALEPLTISDTALVHNDADGSMVAPAGSLSFVSGLTQVTLTDMSFEVIDDTISGFKEFPTGQEQDSLINITLEVVTIPEPSSALLILLGTPLLLRRKR